MYVPPHFDEPDRDALFDLMEAAPLGILVTGGAPGLDANHIPFEIDRKAGVQGVLRCHVARANPVWRELANDDEVLVIFRAGEAYISPQWYPSKQDHHRQVPSWNYQVVHAHGRVTVHDDAAWVRRNVARLTARHEKSQPVPWKMGDAPRDYLDAMVASIMGLEIRVERLVGKRKLSQNKEPRDIRSAGEALVEAGRPTIGEAMLAIGRGNEGP